MLVKNSFSKMEEIDQRKELRELGSDEKLVLEKYKIGSTALDCSIMITIRRINGSLDKRWKDCGLFLRRFTGCFHAKPWRILSRV
jgi:hypothetical protein